jgi:neutral ceramidase
MKSYRRKANLMLSSLLITMILSTGGYAQNTLSVGTAIINITPEKPIPMSGYGSRTGPFEGIHDSIYARAIVFYDGENKAALISAELIGFSDTFCDEVSLGIEDKTGIKKEYLLISAVHSHSGPVTNVYYKDKSQEVDTYVEQLKHKLIQLVIKADRNLKPAHMGAGKGECRMNINRRIQDGKGNIQLGRNPYGPCDHEVGVVRIDDDRGNMLSVLLNWPCHGVVLGPRNKLISGDWPGATSTYIEDSVGNMVVVPVVIGASGDINPIYGPHIDFVDVNSYAYAPGAIAYDLGNEVIRVTNEIQTRSSGKINALRKSIFLRGKNIGNEVEVRLSVIRIGTIVFAGVNGEVFNQIGVKVKAASPNSQTFFITHCNGSCGYLVSDQAIPEGGYEVRSTGVHSGAESSIIDGLTTMIHELSLDR